MIEATKLRYYKHLARAADRHYPRELFREFATMAACTLSMGWREEEYLECVRRLGGSPGVAGSATPEITACCEAFGLLVDEMEAHPYQDLLGPVWMELNSGAGNWNGEFYTPQEVSTAIARITLGKVELSGDRPLTISEPSCGSGNMVLAAVEVLAEHKIPPNRIWVEARDISKTACDMAYINLSLYGVPGEVVHGNTLSMEEWSRWPTRFKAFSPGHQFVQEPTKVMGALSTLIERAIEIGENDGQDKTADERRAATELVGEAQERGAVRRRSENGNGVPTEHAPQAEDGNGAEPERHSRPLPRRASGSDLRLF